MRQATERFGAALNGPHRRATQVLCTPPGSTPIELSVDSCSISMQSGVGRKRSADLSLTPKPGTDLYALVSAPGATFWIGHGIDFGGGDVELLDAFYGETIQGAVSLAAGSIRLSLADMWQRIERCRFLSPRSPAPGTRASIIAQVIIEAIPGAQVDITADGGQYTGGKVWDLDRTQLIRDLAADGALDVAPQPDGTWVIGPEPILNPAAPSWTYRTGEAGNIGTADRERPLDRLYNTVVVRPTDETQTWPQQVVRLVDPTHPRHESKVGVVPYVYSSPTLGSAVEAQRAGYAILQRVVGTTETLTLGALGHPGQEAGDTASVAHPATDTDPGFAATHIVDSVSLDCIAGAMTLNTRSSDQADTEDS